MATSNSKSSPGLVKSASRVLDLFELFEDEQHPMRVNDIVEKLDAPQSSVSMLLKTLHARGYLEFNPETRCYQPSARLSFLGDWAAGPLTNRADIQNVMRQLANITRDTVLLGRQNGLFMQYLAVIESQRELRLVPHTGTQRPLHRSAIGIVLLAEQSDDAIGRVIRRYNAEHGEVKGIADEETLRAAITIARRDGYYRSLGLSAPSAGVIAKVLPSTVGGEPMAIGLGGSIDRIKAETDSWAKALIAAVKSL